jgi:hypothetical protein
LCSQKLRLFLQQLLIQNNGGVLRVEKNTATVENKGKKEKKRKKNNKNNKKTNKKNKKEILKRFTSLSTFTKHCNPNNTVTML